MTLTLGWWFQEHVPESYRAVALPVTLGIAGMPYNRLIRSSQVMRDTVYWSEMAAANRTAHRYMVKHGMPISKSSAAQFAKTSGSFVPGTARFAGQSGARVLRSGGARMAARVGARFVPGLGWAMLAYDLYTVLGMMSD